MIDDRRKPSQPPAPGAGDESLEILAGENASWRPRRPSRRLRVPNDPVPRPAAAPVSEASEAEFDGRITQPDMKAVSASIPPPPADDVQGDSVVIPAPASLPSLDPPAAFAASAAAPATPAATAPSQRPSVRPPSAPPPSVPPPASVRPPSVRPPSVRPPSVRPPADAPALAVPVPSSVRPPSPPPPPPVSTSAPSVPPEGDTGAVRQVRRRIRAVGEGSAPTPPSIAPSAAEPAAEPRSAAPATAAVAPLPEAVAAPEPPPPLTLEDDFHIPPESEEPSRTAGASASESATPAVSARGATDELEHAETVDLALEEATDELLHAVAPAASFEDDIPEVLDETTEEIAIADELAPPVRTAPPAPPVRASIPDTSGRPPPPPPARPAEATRATETATARPAASKEEPRKKRRPWWEDLFGDDYLRTLPRYTPEQLAAEGDFIEASLGVEKGAAVLDLACGTGRHAIELAARGYEVIALDLSLAMLARAADAAQERDAKLNFLHSDMREMEFNEMFDAAYCMNSSFGFFDDDKNVDVARRLHRALKTGGTLLLDVVNRDFAIQQQPSMSWYEGEGCVCMEETSFNYITSRLIVKRTMIFDDGRQRETEYTMRLYSLHELGLLLHNAGFRIVEVSGHPRTPGAFFGPTSRNVIILAQKSAPRSEQTQPRASIPQPPGEKPADKPAEAAAVDKDKKDQGGAS